MPGIDARSGQLLDGFAHVEQSIDKIITTALGERDMREWVGNPGTKLLGENGTEKFILAWVTIIWCMIELFEPRFKIRRFQPDVIDRIGTIGLTIVGDYRPYAHLEWSQAELFISVSDGVVRISSGR